MPDINVNVLDQQNTVNVSAGVYPTLLVDVDHEENTVSVTVEKQTPVVDVQVIATGPVGPQGIQGPPGADGVDGQDGAPGADGADGVSPVISSESITGGHRLTIVDAGGTTTVDVMDGQDGQDGTNGTNGTDGQDGVSPEVSIASITGGHSVTITDADHPTGQTFNVMDGTDGQDGSDGADGTDGVSPGVTIASITGGHSVTITDADHPGGQSFNVMDGEDGQNGQNGVGVPASGSTGQVLAKKSGTDYDTEWVTPSAGSNDVEWVTYGSTTSATIETAYQAGKIVAVLSGDRVHYLQKRNSSTDHLFYAAIDTRFYVCRCTSDSWSNYYYECLELGDTGTLPSGGNAGQLLAKNSATDYDVHWVNKTQDYPSAYCTTAAGTAAKKASCSLWTDTANSYLHVLIGAANTNAGAITLNVNSTGAKPIYINGEASSATNYTLPAGSYIVFYDGTNYYFRTDGKLPADIAGNAANGGVTSVNGQTGDVSLNAPNVGAMSKWTLLWTNASPNSEFLPQTISVALSGFEFIAIVFHQYGDNTNPYGISLGLTNFYGSLYDHEGFRRFTANASSVAFEEGSIRTGGTVAANNQVLIPYQIYGIKGVVNT